MIKDTLKLAALFIFTAVFSTSLFAQSLEKGFINPPDSARPWVYWFWLNGNLSKSGITADLEAMKRVGVGGVLIMEVDQGTPKGNYVFGSPEWRDLFKFMLAEADRLGLKVNMNNDAGWCGSGGPWMTAETSMQKLVWTDTVVTGAKKINLKLRQPQGVNKYYEDIMVLAFPTPEGDDMQLKDYKPEVKVSPNVKDEKNIYDNDAKTVCEIARPTQANPQFIEFLFQKPYTSHTMTINPSWHGWPVCNIKGSIQISDDGKNYKTIGEFNGGAPTITVEYPETSALRYKLIFTEITKEESPVKNFTFSEISFFSTKINNWEQKAMFQPPVNIDMPATWNNVSPAFAMQHQQVMIVTDKMQKDGSFAWTAPKGKWTIVRLGHTTSGKFNHPAPEGGLGYECDKMSKAASTQFYNGLIQKLSDDSKALVGKSFVSTHIDSWEVGSQNWTPGFFDEFKKRRGYDPIPYIPVMLGRIVDNIEISERFLWDLRTTISEMMLENYVTNIRDLAHKNGLRLSIEAYEKCMTDEMVFAGLADEPMSEFWSWDKYGAGFSCTEMTSAAHVYGKKIIGAEAFTAHSGEKWLGHPRNIKDLGDWAFCEGINRFVFHRYAMQPFENIKPGISMGPWGLHYERTQTWWEQSTAWHQYLSRCQYLLQQGLFVADICYMAPEVAPQSWYLNYGKNKNLQPEQKRDSSQYNFDGCPAAAIMSRMSVQNGNIVLPDGMSYHLLVLPESETMTPELLKKIMVLVNEGATVIGNPPKKAIGLTGYPQTDEQVKKMASELWGKCDGKTIKENAYGKGRIIWGKTPEEVLAEMKINRDFASDIHLRYTHRSINGTEVYFIANPSQKEVTTTCHFRVNGIQPEVWNPVTGATYKCAQYSTVNGISMPIHLEPAGSLFVVFKPENKAQVAVSSISRNGQKLEGIAVMSTPSGFEMKADQAGKYQITTNDKKNQTVEVKSIPAALDLKGPWDVSFEAGMGAPAHATFNELSSWSVNSDNNIKYYSGSALYKKTVTIQKDYLNKNRTLKLDLGKVEVMAEVIVNGKNLGILWKAPYIADITSALKAGENQIEVRVVNLWVNRLIGDEQKPDNSERVVNEADAIWGPPGALIKWPQWVLDGKNDPSGRYTFTTWKLWKSDSPLVESGLMGPVKIFVEEKIQFQLK